MNGKRVALTVLAILGIAIAGVCVYIILKGEDETYKFDTQDQPLVNPNTEVIEALFVDKRYTRIIEGDTETISFSSTGKYSYSCSCGNAVDNYDLCEYYTYDGKDKITLVCYDEGGIVDELKIV